MVASSRTLARTAAPEILAVDGGAARLPPIWDPRVPLSNLALIGRRVDSIRRFLADSIDSRTDIGGDGLQAVSSEIASAVQQIILNGAALLAFSQPGPTSAEAAAAAAAIPPPEMPREATDPAVSAAVGPVVSVEARDLARSVDLGGTPVPEESRDRMEQEEDDGGDYEIVEMDAVELLAEHVHFCEICGKGFKRDANLRMHMRAHGNQFKTLEALSKPDHHLESGGDHGPDVLRKTRFSCPFLGCNRNRHHKRFRPLKSAVCVKNHFRRSHCPKIYSCTRCNKKNFSVLADLKSHLKHCGECRWRCSCGTSFSRKDKLFGHMALFEGHMPAVSVGVATGEEDDMDGKGKAVEEDVEEDCVGKDGETDSGLQGVANGAFDPEFFEEFMVDGFGQIDGLGMVDGTTWIDF